ncbi:MAG: hypothetical protein LBU81_04185 [Methanosarcinales archaeon]|jgi:hypothetical protein|nr:hypothetical protein [Methanosarcinales archaeon]
MQVISICSEDEFEELSEDDKAFLSQKIYELKMIRLKKEEFKEEEEIQKDELIEFFKSHHLPSYSAHGIELKYHEPKVGSRFDSGRFKEEKPEMYENYLKESRIREFISIHFFDD